VKTATLGIIVGNRGFFPDHLADKGRKTILKVLQEEGINAVALTPCRREPLKRPESRLWPVKRLRFPAKTG